MQHVVVLPSVAHGRSHSLHYLQSSDGRYRIPLDEFVKLKPKRRYPDGTQEPMHFDGTITKWFKLHDAQDDPVRPFPKQCTCYCVCARVCMRHSLARSISVVALAMTCMIARMHEY